jgi:hypothetical protein
MAIGSALQASVGIGLALLVVPLLALVDQSFIPGPMLLAGAMLALSTAYRERTAIDVTALRSSVIGLAIGTIVGALTLKLVSGPNLNKTLGGLVVLAVLLSVSGYRFNATPRSLFVCRRCRGHDGSNGGHSRATDFSRLPKHGAACCSSNAWCFLLDSLLGRCCCPCRVRIVWHSSPCPRRNPTAGRRNRSCCRPASRWSHRPEATSHHHSRHRSNKRSHAPFALGRPSRAVAVELPPTW